MPLWTNCLAVSHMAVAVVVAALAAEVAAVATQMTKERAAAEVVAVIRDSRNILVFHSHNY